MCLIPFGHRVIHSIRDSVRGSRTLRARFWRPRAASTVGHARLVFLSGQRAGVSNPMSSVLETKTRAGGHARLSFARMETEGIEPSTSTLPASRSSQLSYVPVMDRAGLEPASPGCKPSILPLK